MTDYTTRPHFRDELFAGPIAFRGQHMTITPQQVRDAVQKVMPGARVDVRPDTMLHGYEVIVDQRFTSRAQIGVEVLMHARHDAFGAMVEHQLTDLQRHVVDAFGIRDWGVRRVVELEQELKTARQDAARAQKEAEAARDELAEYRDGARAWRTAIRKTLDRSEVRA